jgi:alpha-tubulin suppressor-like RCC1 family protein
MDDPNGRCAGTCDSTGACKSKQGQTCNTVSAGCISGTVCSPDGYCCDSACTGSCVACDLVGHQGTCTNLAANTAPHTNHSPCAGSGSTCGGSCNGSGACSYPSSTCGSATCSGTSFVDVGTCSQGTCMTPAARTCDGGLVCSANACKTSCTADADCLSTHFCASDGACHRRALQIACGSRTTCALLNDNSIWCAGLNDSGQLGSGAVTTASPYGSNTAVQVAGLPANDAPQQIAPGGHHTCARLASGAVYCWGDGSSGQMGTGAGASSLTPVKVPLAAGASLIASGDQFVCAALTNSTVWCWGADYDGELGDGTYTNGRNNQFKPSPVQVVTNLFTMPSAMTASTATMHVMAGTGVFSWGEDQFGELGTGTATTTSPYGNASPVSTPYAGFAVAISAASAGDHACLLTSGGIIRCWGNNGSGQLGNGMVNTTGVTMPGEATPDTVSGLTGTPSAVFAGGFHTCALMTNGDLDCWGDDTDSELGDTTSEPTMQLVKPSPVKATVVPGTPTSAALGQQHTCVLLKNGSVWCWGSNLNGQLGNGNFIDSPSAVRVTGW